MVQQLILAAIAFSYSYRTRRGSMCPCRDKKERTGPQPPKGKIQIQEHTDMHTHHAQ